MTAQPVEPRPITKVGDGLLASFAHPCGCVGETTPENIIEACGGPACRNFPRVNGVSLVPAGVKVRGKPCP